LYFFIAQFHAACVLWHPVIGGDIDMEDKNMATMPPYISPGTFRNFLDSVKKTGLPGRVDKSVPFIASKSGLVQGQLQAALEFLGLISEKGIPTQRFHDLCTKQAPEEISNIRQEMVRSAYPFLFDNFDLERATTNQIGEAFKTHAKVSASSMQFRCVAFFVAIAKDSGIKVSPHIKATNLQPKPTKETKTSSIGNRTDQSKDEELNDNGLGDEKPLPAGGSSWGELLLAKFPQFDPTWNDDLKSKWFDAFDQFMKRDVTKK
jgi:hypothetical protein